MSDSSYLTEPNDSHRLIYLSVLTIFVLLVYLLFRGSISGFFFQDDWFSLLISQGSLVDFAKFFIPRKDVVYYRPFGMQVPFYISQILFGINPLPFRVVTYVVHLINGFLVFKLLNLFIKNKKLSAAGTFMYLTSAAHMIIFYWAATFAFVLGPTFYFITCLLFLKNKQKLALLTFVLGLLTNEMLITLPVMLFLYNHFCEKVIISRVLKWFSLITSCYVAFRYLYFPIPNIKDYQLLTSIKQIAINIRDYVLWSLNWPDEIRNQFTTFFFLNRQFMKDFNSYLSLLIFNTGFLISCAVATITAVFLKNGFNNTKVTKALILGGGWFFLSLMPVLFFSQHAFSYYVPIPLWGLILCILSILKSLNNYIRSPIFFTAVLLTILLSWYYSSWQTIYFDTLTHWVPRRSLFSQQLTTRIKAKFNTLPQDASVEISASQNTLEEYKLALGDQNALKVIYADNSVDTLYRQENREKMEPSIFTQIPDPKKRIFKL